MNIEQVWIVDDDSSIRWVLDKALSGAGITSASFDNAENLLLALDHLKLLFQIYACQILTV